MKLSRISVEGTGRFGTRASLEGLGPGVNILCARNEAGKSTLFHAVRTCLFERHNTTREEVKRLATDGLSLPITISIAFEHAGQSLELTKSFLRSQSAKLIRNGVEIARNRDADEQIWEILGITPDKNIDQGAYGVLWVKQGDSFYIPQPTEAGASVLNNVIQQEVGTLVGGERARQLLKDVKSELGILVTEGGKARTRGPIDMAQRHHEAVEAERLEAETRLVELDANLEMLNGLRAEFARLNDPQESQRLAAELSGAEAAFKLAAESAKALQLLENDERRTFQLLGSQRELLESILARARSIDENRNRLNNLRLECESFDEAARSIESQLLAARTTKASLEHEVDLNDALDRKLQRLTALAHKAAARQTLQDRLAILQSFEARLIENEQALKSVSTDDSALRALESIERNLDSISLRMEAAAPRLTLDRKADATVTVNGGLAAEHVSCAVTEPLTIALGDEVTIVITPAAASLALAETARREEQAKLRALLAQHGASSATELRQLRAERIVLEDTSRALKAERAALGLRDGNAAAEILRLQVEIRQLDAETQKALAETGTSLLATPDSIEAQRQSTLSARSDLKAKLAEAIAVVEGLSANLNRATQARADINGRIRELDSQISGDLAAMPDHGRDQVLRDAERLLEQRRSDHAAYAALLAEKRQTATSPHELERLGLRAERLRRASDNRSKELVDLRERMARLAGQVQTAGGEGLGEKVAELRAEAALALGELNRQTERAEVLQLLRSVVEDAYDRRRDQLDAPLHRHLQPFLQDVFPAARLTLGDGFSVEALKRTGPEDENFGRLSKGTQEQIAVLVRLAMGAMIAEKGHDVPIILDDALVFSDDARIEQMFDAINRAGRNQQVIVFTCRARSFASLGGNQLHIS